MKIWTPDQLESYIEKIIADETHTMYKGMRCITEYPTDDEIAKELKEILTGETYTRAVVAFRDDDTQGLRELIPQVFEYIESANPVNCDLYIPLFPSDDGYYMPNFYTGPRTEDPPIEKNVFVQRIHDLRKTAFQEGLTGSGESGFVCDPNLAGIRAFKKLHFAGLKIPASLVGESCVANTDDGEGDVFIYKEKIKGDFELCFEKIRLRDRELDYLRSVALSFRE